MSRKTHQMCVLVFVVGVLAILGPVSPAPAAVAPANGISVRAANCPVSDPSVVICLFAEMTGGEMVVGKKSIPIAKTITLQVGLVPGLEVNSLNGAGATNGDTLSKTPLNVPGGLAGVVSPAFLPRAIRENFNNAIDKGLSAATVTAELAGPPSAIVLNITNLLDARAAALELPVRVKLSNAFLGNSCYIGSATAPIMLRLGDGATSPPPPNKPIVGALGLFAEIFEPFDGHIVESLVIDGTSLVDNMFSSPEVKGCGGAFSNSIDPAIDTQIGLPSPSGHNTMIMHSTLWLSSPEEIRGEI